MIFMISEKDLENSILGFHRKLVDEMHKEAERLNFTPSQLQVVQFVSENENPTMKEIAVALGITPPSATTIVEALCDTGILRREVDTEDRRVIRVTITPKTFKAFSKLKDAKLIILKNLFSKLNDADREMLNTLINKIISE
jgi:DNA-binding MarR family transcriptional regulator